MEQPIPKNIPLRYKDGDLENRLFFKMEALRVDIIWGPNLLLSWETVFGLDTWIRNAPKAPTLEANQLLAEKSSQNS